MSVRTSIPIFLFGVFAASLLAQPDEARTGFDNIRAEALTAHIYFLSSEEWAGSSSPNRNSFEKSWIIFKTSKTHLPRSSSALA